MISHPATGPRSLPVEATLPDSAPRYTMQISGSALDRSLAEVGYEREVTRRMPQSLVQSVINTEALTAIESRFHQAHYQREHEADALEEQCAYRAADASRRQSSLARITMLTTAGYLAIQALIAAYTLQRDPPEEPYGDTSVAVADADVVPEAPFVEKQEERRILKPVEDVKPDLKTVVSHTRGNPIFQQILQHPELTPEQARSAAKRAAGFLSDGFLRAKAVGATVIIDSAAGNFTGTILGTRAVITSKHAAMVDGKPHPLTSIQSGPRMYLRTTWNHQASPLHYVVHADPASDLAVIVFSQDLFSAQDAVTIASDAPQKGQPLILCASPGGIKRSPKSGYIRGTEDHSGKGELLAIETNAPMEKGNSGGLVLNEKGELVGIHSLGSKHGSGSLTQLVTLETVNVMLNQAHAQLPAAVAQALPISKPSVPRKPRVSARPGSSRVTNVSETPREEPRVRPVIILDWDKARRNN